MDLIGLVATYGYFIVFLGGVLDGEIFFILAGLAAHEGFLSLPLIFFWASLGAIFAETTFFLLGKYCGETIIARWPYVEKFLEKPRALVNQNLKMAAILVRFLYGIRNFILFSLGMSEVKAEKFLGLNTVGIVVWVTCVTTIGYFFGDVLQVALGGIKIYELRIFAGFLLVVLFIFLNFTGVKMLVKRFFS